MPASSPFYLFSCGGSQFNGERSAFGCHVVGGHRNPTIFSAEFEEQSTNVVTRGDRERHFK